MRKFTVIFITQAHKFKKTVYFKFTCFYCYTSTDNFLLYFIFIEYDRKLSVLVNNE